MADNYVDFAEKETDKAIKTKLVSIGFIGTRHDKHKLKHEHV